MFNRTVNKLGNAYLYVHNLFITHAYFSGKQSLQILMILVFG